jgi:cytochrome c553
MTRPLPIAASFALASLALAAFAQTPPAQPAPQQPASQQPASQQPVPQQPSPQPSAPASPAPAPAANTAPAPAAATGNPENGRALTYTCQGCHGITGYKNAYPNYHVPRIGGQSGQYLVNALTEYKKGTRKHPTMQAQSQSFSEQDIADIAAFLSGLKP